MKSENLLIILIGILLITPLFIAALFEDQLTRPELCVDGDGDINLQGIMCEKEIDTVFGYESGSQTYRLIMTIVVGLGLSGACVVTVGVFRL